jgi:hypothetical protein
MTGPLADAAQRVNDDFAVFYAELAEGPYVLPPEAWALLFVIAEEIRELHRVVEEANV